MMYQQMLTGAKPYFVTIGPMLHFLAHRHPELEINYCISGSYEVQIENKLYTIRQEDITLVSSRASHEMFSGSSDCRVLTIEVGPMLLKEHFNAFSQVDFQSPVYSPEEDDPNRAAFAEKAGALLRSVAWTYAQTTESAELQVLGDIYKLCACVMEEIQSGRNIVRKQERDLRAVANIEKALDLVYSRYNEKITVEDAAELTGYQKSNFCKIFKSVVGDSFHRVLNRYRVEMAQALLRESDSSVEEISLAVGFADSKSFCRVFKTLLGMTPGQYRSAMGTGRE